MLQFLQSIWLWAAAGIIIPLIIHLWNVREGKIFKVGSIALLSESSKAHAKSFKLNELLVLLLRCLLVVVLAMLIARPYMQKELEAGKEKGWILIEKSHLKEAYEKFRTAIDTLIKSGYSFHYFNPGFAEAKLEDVLKLAEDPVKERGFSYWAMLKELDKKVPATLPVYLFTDNNLNRFRGSKPTVSLNLKWSTYTSPDTASVWLEKAYVTTSDSIRVIVGHSNSTGIYYSYENITSASQTYYAVKVVDGKPFVTYNNTSKNSINNTVEVDTAGMRIAIFTDKFNEDAGYLKAAINAIRDFGKYKIKVTIVNSVATIPENIDWLFWLSESEVPVSKIKTNIFVYEKGKVNNVESSIVTKDEAEVTTATTAPLFKYVQSNSARAGLLKTIWSNGFGEPILSVEKRNRTIYHFYSRFNPQWTDLTWNSSFPQVIYQLLFGAPIVAAIGDVDKRLIDVSQIQPVITAVTKASPKESVTDKRDLTKVFWVIAFVLFTLERIIAFRLKKEDVYG